jgi:hypothetical protein
MKYRLADTGGKNKTKGTEMIRLRSLLDLTSYKKNLSWKRDNP